ncbi:MAG: MBL fold metallo-hydrolase [Pseudomonadota bacterium]
MASPIPFVRDFDFEYGRCDQINPVIRRVVANNPGSFTFTGTNVYIVGRGEVAVLDPGPIIEEHFEALKVALEGETVTHVLVSHGHSDHSPLAKPLAAWAGCETHAYGCAVPTAKGELGSEDDPGFQPDHTLCDGDIISGPGWTLEAIHTPGHTKNHLCFALKEQNLLFCGDHIMGWSTTIVAPPDGDMGDYMRSLKKVQDRNFDVLWPSHGPAITDDVSGFIEAYMDHRRGREAAVLDHLQRGYTSIPEMVSEMYADVDKKLHPAAALSVLGHIRELVKQGIVHSSDAEPLVNSKYRMLPQAAE